MVEGREQYKGLILGELAELKEIVGLKEQEQVFTGLSRFNSEYSDREQPQVTAVKKLVEEEVSVILELDTISKTKDFTSKSNGKFTQPSNKEIVEDIKDIQERGERNIRVAKLMFCLTIFFFLLTSVIKAGV